MSRFRKHSWRKPYKVPSRRLNGRIRQYTWPWQHEPLCPGPHPHPGPPLEGLNRHGGHTRKRDPQKHRDRQGKDRR